MSIDATPSTLDTVEMFPPLLRRRLEEHKIPPLAHQPVFDRIVVWRLSEKLKKTAGGLFVPDVVEEEPDARGVLLGAGLKALDILRSNGIDLGHIVTFARFAGWERQVKREVNDGPRHVYLQAQDIVGSEDLLAQIKKETHRVVVEVDEASDDYGKHFIIGG